MATNDDDTHLAFLIAAREHADSHQAVLSEDAQTFVTHEIGPTAAAAIEEAEREGDDERANQSRSAFTRLLDVTYEQAAADVTAPDEAPVIHAAHFNRALRLLCPGLWPFC